MTTQPQRKPILRWTTPKNLLTILTFTAITIITRYLTLTLADPPATTTLLYSWHARTRRLRR